MSVYLFEEWNLNESQTDKEGKIVAKNLLETITKLSVNKNKAVSTEVVRKFNFLDFEEFKKKSPTVEEIKQMKDVNYFLNTFKYLDGLKILVNPTVAGKDLNYKSLIPNYAYDYSNLPELIMLPVPLTKYIVRFFMAAGLSKSGAVALAANFWKESRFNPHQNQIGGGPGFGLAQWGKKDRWSRFVDSFLSMFRSSSPNFSSLGKYDLDSQLSYTLYEMRTSYNEVYSELMRPYRLEEKVILIMKKYEVCRDRNKPAEQKERFDVAKNIYVICAFDHWIDVIQKSMFVLRDIDMRKFLA